MNADSIHTLVNFGGNHRWRARRYRPRDEREVLDILARHRAERVRAIGSLHSWSDVAASSDVVLDMSEFAEVAPRAAEGVVRVLRHVLLVRPCLACSFRREIALGQALPARRDRGFPHVSAARAIPGAMPGERSGRRFSQRVHRQGAPTA
jgi:hypothetical protein